MLQHLLINYRTDANVFIILHGDKGDSGKRALESAGNNFERGRVDSFGIEAFDFGELTKITIGHDGSGFFFLHT